MTHRRNVLKGAAAAAAGMACGWKSNFVSAADNPITRENANAGSTDWQLTRVRTDTRALCWSFAVFEGGFEVGAGAF